MRSVLSPEIWSIFVHNSRTVTFHMLLEENPKKKFLRAGFASYFEQLIFCCANSLVGVILYSELFMLSTIE